MAGFRAFLRSGHSPTLFAAFFYLTFSFVIWVMNGTMAPFISEQFNLTPAQKACCCPFSSWPAPSCGFHWACWRSTWAARPPRWSS